MVAPRGHGAHRTRSVSWPTCISKSNAGVLPGWIFDEVMALPYHLHQTDRAGLGFGRRAKFITTDPVEGPKERQAAWLSGRTF